MGNTVDLAVRGGIAAITLSRPEVRNAFNAEMIADLTSTIDGLAARSDVRAVLLQGQGKSFSAGADIQWMRASLEYSYEENLADAERMSGMFAAIRSLPVPVVGRVHGAALGGGMGLVAVCDIVVAAHNTIFGFTESKLGIIPAVISPFVLPKLGASWARALYLTGERFGPEIAQLTGLVHWIVPDHELDSAVQARIEEILSSGPLAVREAKRLITDLQGVTDDEARATTVRLIAALRTGDEGQEGLRAFLEKRAPAWRVGE